MALFHSLISLSCWNQMFVKGALEIVQKGAILPKIKTSKLIDVIHFSWYRWYYQAAKTYCVSLIMLFISSTWDVCYVHTDTISSPWELPIVLSGLDPSFVSLLLSLSLSLPPLLPHTLPPPLSQNLILKKDYWKTTWVISCRPENYPPVEKTPKTLSLPPTFPLYLSLSFYSLPVEIWRDDNNSRGMVRWGWFRGGGRSLFLSVCLSCSLHSLPAEIWRAATTTVGDFGREEGRETEMCLPSDHLSAEAWKRGEKGGRFG